jgi:hypothetical protein
VHHALRPRATEHQHLFAELLAEQQRTNRLLQGLLYFAAGCAAGAIGALALFHLRTF